MELKKTYYFFALPLLLYQIWQPHDRDLPNHVDDQSQLFLSLTGTVYQILRHGMHLDRHAAVVVNGARDVLVETQTT